MVWQNSLILIQGLMVAMMAWAGVLFVIPWCQRARFRHRLWRLRDEITDDIINEILPDHDAVYDLREQIDSFIRYAREVTFLKVALVLVTARAVPPEALPAVSYDGLSPDQTARLRQYRQRLSKAMGRLLISGSVSGWLVAIVVGVFLIPYWRITGNGKNQGRPKDVAAKTVSQQEVDSLPDLLVRSRRHSRRSDSEGPLSACY